MRLPELQQRFQDAVLADAPDHSSVLEADGHFEIYVNAYRARLLEALRDNYPVLHRALGDAGFDELGRAYLEAHPSHYRSIRWFGDALPGFAERRPALLPHPALIDLARMDWALRNAFDAADASPLRRKDLVAIRPENWPALTFRPVPSLTIVELSWQVEPIWQALSEDASAQTDAPSEHPHSLLVWRRGLECQWRSLEPVESEGLALLVAGEPFARLCEPMAKARAGESAMLVAGFLQRWIDEELLAKD